MYCYLNLNSANKRRTFCWVGSNMPLLKIVLDRLVLAPDFKQWSGFRIPYYSAFLAHRTVTSVSLSALLFLFDFCSREMFTLFWTWLVLWVSSFILSCVWSWKDVIKDELPESCWLQNVTSENKSNLKCIFLWLNKLYLRYIIK